MQTTLKYVALLCAGSMLLACADLSGHAARSFGVAADPGADDAYALGRRQHLAGDHGAALASYRAALRSAPHHVNAGNGLATLYAQRGDFAQAVPIWDGLTRQATLGSGPGTAFLFSNLGYAYFLSGDYDRALPALEKACLLDPLNHHAWQHLGNALQMLGQQERARQMWRQARALQKHDFRTDDAAVGASTQVPAIDAAVKETARPDPEWAATHVHVGADGILELRRIPAAPRAALPGSVRLEIRNGNGVNGMAKSLALQMDEPGLKVVRLTNDKGFQVARTRVEYRPALRDVAERLAQRFGHATVVEVDDCTGSDMRLVLGRDLVRARGALGSLAQAALTASAEPGKAG